MVKRRLFSKDNLHIALSYTIVISILIYLFCTRNHQ